MPGRYRQLRMRDPDVFLLLPATSLAHRHARILRTFPVDLFSFCFTYPDLHHGLLTATRLCHPARMVTESLGNNHGFLGGNKRIAFTATDVFLRRHGYYIEVGGADGYAFVSGAMDRNEL